MKILKPIKSIIETDCSVPTIFASFFLIPHPAMVNECEPWVRAIFGFCCLRISQFCQAFAQRRVKLIVRR